MKAYTLIEVIVAVLLLALILLGGTGLFYQNLRSSGLSDVESEVNNTMQSILMAVEKDVRYSEVTGVDSLSRLECLAAGANGVVGNSLKVSDLNGLETIYSLDNERIASTSSQTSAVTYLSSTRIVITNLEFTWFCYANISDKIKVAIDAESSILSSGIKVERSISTEINLLNSGLN